MQHKCTKDFLRWQRRMALQLWPSPSDLRNQKQVGGWSSRNLRADLDIMIKNGYKGYFTQELTAPAYYLDPFKYDKRNIQNLRMYMEE